MADVTLKPTPDQTFEIEGRGGPAPLRFSREKMPLSEFLTTFGLSVQDVQNYLKL